MCAYTTSIALWWFSQLVPKSVYSKRGTIVIFTIDVLSHMLRFSVAMVLFMCLFSNPHCTGYNYVKFIALSGLRCSPHVYVAIELLPEDGGWLGWGWIVHMRFLYKHVICNSHPRCVCTIQKWKIDAQWNVPAKHFKIHYILYIRKLL